MEGASEVTALRSAFTESDIVTLVRGETEDERATAAHKLCRRIDAGVDEEEREVAADVLRLMARDAAELVRRALAVTLKMSPALPRDVALMLAKDVDDIAGPVLSFSPVFTDEDLSEIVEASGGLKQLAVARRAALSETVTSALVRHGCEQAVRTACANDDAVFEEASLIDAVERFADSEAVAVAIAYRKSLPPAISEKLVALVSDQVRQPLIDHHALAPETAMQIALGARERATIDLVDQAGRATDLRAFTAHLHRHHRLTASLLLRTLAHGHMSFFEHALAELASVPHHRTWMMIHDAGPLGLRAVYERSGLPGTLYPAFRAGVDTYHGLQHEQQTIDLEAFQQRMIERYLTQEQAAAPQDVDYLLERMDRLIRPPNATTDRQLLSTAA